MVKSLKKIFLKSPAIIFVLSLLLTVSWFRYGHFYGGGDIGLPLYDPQVSAKLTAYTWWDSQGTGLYYPGVFSSQPLYLIFSLLQRAGLPPFLLQALFFFLVLFLSGFGVYKLSLLLGGSRLISIFAGLYYLVNPYSMMNVWHRFNHGTMVLLAFIPWSLVFIYLGLYKKQLRYAVYLSLISVVGAYAFGTPAFIATWGFLVFVFWFWYFLRVAGRGRRLFSVYFLLTFLFFWAGVNSWWLFSFAKSATGALFMNSSPAGNIESLKGVSQYFTLPYALRGINSFYLTEQKDWGEIYNHFVFKLLSWVGFAVILSSFLIKKKTSAVLFFAFIFLSSVFFSKGSGFPLGGLVVFLLDRVPLLGVFRNPFEKFGILIPFSSAFLFGCGISYVLEKIDRLRLKKASFAAFAFLVFSFFGIYHWPIWTGNIFGSIEKPAFVEVPKDYKEASDWLERNGGSNIRIFHLPYALSDGIVYNWEYGYHGLEPSQIFFRGSSISHALGFGIADRRYQKLAEAVRHGEVDIFKSLLSKFGIEYIVLHEDVDYNVYTSDTNQNIKGFLDSLHFLKKDQQFGKLAIYSVVPRQDVLRVAYVGNPVFVSGDISYFDESLLGMDKDKTAIYAEGVAEKDKQYIFPDVFLIYPTVSVSRENAINELPYVRFLPGDPRYPLVIIKENLSLLPKTEEERFWAKLQFAGKRLVELDRLVDSEEGVIQELVRNYKGALSELKDEVFAKTKTENILARKQIIEELQAIFFRQRQAVDYHILPKASDSLKGDIVGLLDYLDEFMKEVGLVRFYEIDNNQPSVTFRMSVCCKGKYFLQFSRKTWEEHVGKDGKSADVYIDGVKAALPLEVDGKLIRTTPIFLDPGKHEFTFLVSDKNLFEGSKELKTAGGRSENGNLRLLAESKESYRGFGFEKADSDSLYSFTFSFLTMQGLPPSISVIEDINPKIEGKIRASIKKQIGVDDYQFGWRNSGVLFVPNSFSKSAEFRVSVSPWNNCESIYKQNKKICKDPLIYQMYNRNSTVEIKELALKRIPTRGLVLVSDIKEPPYFVRKVSYDKESPVSYKVQVPEVDGEGFIVFRETYSDFWQMSSGTGRVSNHYLADGYANAWKVGKGGFEAEVFFTPQEAKRQGMFMGVLLIFVGFVAVAIGRRYGKLL